jgi:hypothetical protein
MAPIWPDLQTALEMTSRFLPRAIPDLPSQWRSPGDVLSVLLLLGGDLVQAAVAEFGSAPYGFCPVPFSFGWAAFALSTVLMVLDDGHLLPRQNKPSIVINASNGISRINH